MNPSRRFASGGTLPSIGSLHSKSRTTPFLSIGLLILVFLVSTDRLFLPFIHSDIALFFLSMACASTLFILSFTFVENALHHKSKERI